MTTRRWGLWGWALLAGCSGFRNGCPAGQVLQGDRCVVSRDGEVPGGDVGSVDGARDEGTMTADATADAPPLADAITDAPPPIDASVDAGSVVEGGTDGALITDIGFEAPAFADLVTDRTSFMDSVDAIDASVSVDGVTDAAGLTCRPGETRCASGCVDTTRDVDNCGACGRTCLNAVLTIVSYRMVNGQRATTSNFAEIPAGAVIEFMRTEGRRQVCVAGACLDPTGCFAGTTCRPAAGLCDAVEMCAAAGTCPANELLAASTTCRAGVANACNPAEVCTGTSAACPDDISTSCRAGESCVNGTCTTATGMCPTGTVLIPAGSFVMGAPAAEPGANGNEQPQRTVTLSAYCLGRTEVTVAQYQRCVTQGSCTPPNTAAPCNWEIPGFESHPINCIDWAQAGAICAFLYPGTGRLPTEAEWENAATDGGTRRYPWGDTTPLNQLCWSGGGISRISTCVPGGFPGGNTPSGIQDLSGNVYEWVSDWFGTYPGRNEMNPTGPTTGSMRVFRGGGWSVTDAARVRACDRNSNVPSYQDSRVGVRCVSAVR